MNTSPRNDAAPSGDGARGKEPNTTPHSTRPACILCGGTPVGRGAFSPHGGGVVRWYWTCARHKPDRPGAMRLIELALGFGKAPP